MLVPPRYLHPVQKYVYGGGDHDIGAEITGVGLHENLAGDQESQQRPDEAASRGAGVRATQGALVYLVPQVAHQESEAAARADLIEYLGDRRTAYRLAQHHLEH